MYIKDNCPLRRRPLDKKPRIRVYFLVVHNPLSSHCSKLLNDTEPKPNKLVNESLSSDVQLSQKLFVKERDLIQLIYLITEKRKAKAQIQLALVAALENALRIPNGTFEFVVNTVRQRCMDLKIYDGPDFFINFRFVRAV